jgi:hypothetical protein
MGRTPLLLLRNTVAVLGMLGTGQHSAAEYYLTPSGSDANPGTQARPWKTITKADNTLQPGDTVYIMNGEYQNKINTFNSGEASRYITYRAYLWPEPVITALPSRVAILLQNRSYVYRSLSSGGQLLYR